MRELHYYNITKGQLINCRFKFAITPPPHPSFFPLEKFTNENRYRYPLPILLGPRFEDSMFVF